MCFDGFVDIKDVDIFFLGNVDVYGGLVVVVGELVFIFVLEIDFCYIV